MVNYITIYFLGKIRVPMADRETGTGGGNAGSSGQDIIYANNYLELNSGADRPGRGLYKLALSSVVATFALIVLGGVVRVTGSGLGCGGEWPLCDGSLIPPLTKEDIIEYSHRLVASAIVGPLVLGTFLVAFFRYRRGLSVVIPSAVSVALLLAQGGLGGVTVLTELPGHIVAAHMALAQALFACLILVAVAAGRLTQSDMSAGAASGAPVADFGATETRLKKPDRFPLLATVAAFATYALLLSGSYVTATPGALAACPQWPLCHGDFWPSGSLETIHMLHRVVAAVVGLFLLYVCYRGYRLGRQRPTSGGAVLLFLSATGAIVFLTQVFIGAVAIWTNFPVAIRAYHIGLATAVWGIMVAVALYSRHRPDPDQAVLRESYVAPAPESARPGQESA